MRPNPIIAGDFSHVKIGLISTTHTNVGDDLIRVGIINLLSATLPGALKFTVINKHRPLQAYRAGSAARLFDVTALGRHRVERSIWRSASTWLGPISQTVFDDCDLLVNCGMPAFWPNWQHAEWVRPLWYDVVPRMVSRGANFCNLSIGSAFPWSERNEILLSDEEGAAIRKLIAPAAFTTTRDSLTAALIERLGYCATKLCCTSIFAFRGRSLPTDGHPVFIINYMRNASHFSWAAKRNSAWRETVARVLRTLGQRKIGIRFYCHSIQEYESTGEDFPGYERVCPEDAEAFYQYARGCVGSLSTRFHASLGLAGMGIPGIVVAEDSRSVMVEEIGNRFLYAPEAGPDIVLAEVDCLLAESLARSQELIARREESWDRYLAYMDNALGMLKPSLANHAS